MQTSIDSMPSARLVDTDEHAQSAVQPPMARGRLPLVGHLVPLILQRVKFMQALRPQGDIVRIQLGSLPVYVLNSLELTHRVLVTQSSHFEQGRVMTKAQSFLGETLVTTDGSVHHRQRRLMQPAFHRDRIARYADIMAKLAAAKAASWRPNQTLVVDNEMLDLTLSIVTQTLVNADDSFDIAEIQRLVHVIFSGLALRTIVPADMLSMLPTPGNRRYKAASARFRQVVVALIAAYRADGRDRGDVLSMLLSAQDQQTGEVLTEQQVHDEIVEITIAGHETTGVTLAWFFHELARNPDVERRVHTEVDAVLGGRQAGYADLPKLEYTRRAITETLRLRHPSWILMKRAVTPVTLGRFHLPAGAEILFSLHALHRDPVLYPNPMTFDPDRWLPEHAKDRPRFAFMPFGAGRHVCIGESFAWMSMILAAATIASRWRLRPVPGRPVREWAHIAIHPVPLLMTAIPR